MTEGRMKGQAFIKFESVEAASRALNEVHGYLLHEKPILIVSRHASMQCVCWSGLTIARSNLVAAVD